jgi:hypothetical protein
MFDCEKKLKILEAETAFPIIMDVHHLTRRNRHNRAQKIGEISFGDYVTDVVIIASDFKVVFFPFLPFFFILITLNLMLHILLVIIK